MKTWREVAGESVDSLARPLSGRRSDDTVNEISSQLQQPEFRRLQAFLPAAFVDLATLVPLILLPAGQVANVAAIAGDGEVVSRLRELGLRQGVQVQMLQPGTPCIIKLGDQSLCLRGGELSNVLVHAQL